MTRVLPLVGLSLLFATACKKDGAIPSYILFSTPVVVDASGHPVSSKITDLWVYVDDKPVGVWEPQRRIPVIAEGMAEVKLVAGIRRNGLVDDRVQYPFYSTWQQQVSLVKGQVATVDPQVRYFDGLDTWLADFNSGSRFDTVQCTATLVLLPSDSTLVDQGSQYGRISLGPGHDTYLGVSSGDAFTGTGSPVFLEMDYRSDTRVLVGVRYQLMGVQQQVGHVYLKPTKASDGSMPWNKIYIDLSEPWAVSAAVDKRFFLKAALENGATSGTVDVDNIKLVRR